MTLLYFIISCTQVDSRVSLISSWGNNYFLPTYTQFEEESKTLHEGIETLCQNPTPELRTQVQEQWWKTRKPWKELEILSFGPYKDYPLRLGPQIDFWPVRTDTVDDILADTTALSPESFYNSGVSTKGMPVIEYLLYDRSGSLLEDPRFCSYLIAASYDLAIRANEMREAWDPNKGNYLAQLTKAGEVDGAYETTEEALAEIVNRLGHTIENIRTDKLLKPLGLETGTAQVAMLESRFSNRGLMDISDNLKGISTVYYGTDDGLGIDDYLHDRGYDLDEEFDKRYTDIMQTVNIVSDSGPMQESIIISPESILYLSDQLGALQTLIQGDILGGMSLWLTFNDADGD